MQRYLFLVAAAMAVVVVAVRSDCVPGAVAGPCVCIQSGEDWPDVECTGVIDGAEVTEALDQLQVTSLSKLSISSSPLLTSLPDNAFGSIWILTLQIYDTGLKSLSASVFNSYTSNQLTNLYIKYNKAFTNLEPDLVAALPALQKLYISANAITTLQSPLPFTSLQYIDLTQNSIHSITNDFFTNAEYATIILLGYNSLTSDSFASSSHRFSFDLEDLYLDLGWNQIEEGIPATMFSEKAPRELVLSGNGIKLLTESRFSPLITLMASQHIGTNRPYVLVDNNPLVCGCEVAWMVDHPDRSLLTSGVCNNGQMLENLGSADFQDCL